MFQTESIPLVADSLLLFWGIPLDEVVAQMGLGIFVGGGWNVLDIGFKVAQTVPIGSQLTFRLYVGASEILTKSITSNLPMLNGTSDQVCSYSTPYLTCTPIDAFTSTSLRYFIAFKAFFTASDNYSDLGSIKITLVGKS